MANDGMEPTVPEPTATTNQTEPPALWWSPWRGVLQRVETGKGYRCLRDWSRIFDLPSDAVRLAPEPPDSADLDAAADRAHNAYFEGELAESGIERELWRNVVRAVRLAPQHPRGSDNLEIIDGWLVERTNEHMCAGGTPESSYMHEESCGLEPIVNLAELPGFRDMAPQGEPRPLRAGDFVQVHIGSDVGVGQVKTLGPARIGRLVVVLPEETTP